MSYFLTQIVYLHFCGLTVPIYCMSFMVETLKRGLITEGDGNIIWSKMLAKKRKLPENTFSEYLVNQHKDV